MNATLSVQPLGKGIAWKDFAARSAVYGLASMASGALFGFFFTIFIYLSSFWIPLDWKRGILICFSALYLLRELGWISLPIPQCRWQIPTSWVQHTPLRNMLVWGSVLGPGVFTYNPHITFYILYLYTGFFFSPPMGLIGGAVYGLSRCVLSIICAARSTPVWSQGERWICQINSLTLVMFMVYVGLVMEFH